jgi:hypothetical protein
MDVLSAVQNQTMAQLGDDDFDEGVETFRRLFAANLGEIAKQKTITLWFPRVEFTGDLLPATISISRAGAAASPCT